ncbi:MAG TPA: hypothetical protein VM099_14120, partial [Gemmatimonadaceae bacterium]|nr:hypothetical protein [Gemmatimonadaceae bacterium]
MPSFHTSFPDAKAVRSALAAGAVAGLVVIAACTDAGSSSKSLTAPAGPRTATTTTGTQGHGNGLAAIIQVCVDASSPAGTYKFRNSHWNDNHAMVAGSYAGTSWGVGGADPGDGGELLTPNDGSRVFTPAEGNNSEYTVAVGACQTVLERTAYSAHYAIQDPQYFFGPDFQDDFQSLRVTYSTIPAGVQYDHTDCVTDVGVVDPQPTPCGTGSQVVKAFANYDHGTKVTYVFTQGTTSTGLIAPTATTCADYRNGNAPAEPGIFVGLKNGKINNAAPGVFFYYAHVNTTGMGTKTIGFTQSISSSAGLNYLYGVQQGQAYLYNQSCSVVATLPANGTGLSMPAGNYILGIKFTT